MKARGWLPLIAAALLAAPWLLPDYALEVAIQALILALFATAFNLVFAETGLLSFGHAAFFGTGAYATALLMQRAGWPYLLTLPVAVVAAGLLALTIGFFSVRTSRIYFTMLTLAFAQLVWAVVHKWYAFTGGDNGITGLHPGALWGDARALYYLALVLFALGLAFVWRLHHAPFGYALRAIRDNPARAEAVGLSPFGYLLAAFTLSGALAGAAGFLQVAWQRSAFPDFLYWTKSAEVIIAAILGGAEAIFGPALGSLVFVELGAFV
ncbi:branched-chain amino acid ABC transporter permease [Oceanithermus sp.]